MKILKIESVFGGLPELETPRLKGILVCCVLPVLLLLPRISYTQETGPGNAGAANFRPVPAVSAEAETSYPNPSNYKNFKYHAVIIGVDIMNKNGSGSTCHNPFAMRLAAFLKKWRCFPKGGITVLKGAKATKRQIKKTITALHLGPKDVLVIYYGGHGDLKGIISIDRKNNYISPAELSDWAERSGAGFKALLVSACYSGIFVRPEERGSGFQRPGFAVVASGEEEGTSTYTDKGIGFGPYLWKLLNIQQGKAGRAVTLGEFMDFIKKENADWEENGTYRLNDGRSSGPEDSVLFWN
ncbi:MAG: hypothetical protein NTX59_04295 [Elusimicrobia bacterium]|nr:hypothetical protein [Elusimicrobiota bacterium]